MMGMHNEIDLDGMVNENFVLTDKDGIFAKIVKIKIGNKIISAIHEDTVPHASIATQTLDNLGIAYVITESKDGFPAPKIIGKGYSIPEAGSGFFEDGKFIPNIGSSSYGLNLYLKS